MPIPKMDISRMNIIAAMTSPEPKTLVEKCQIPIIDLAHMDIEQHSQNLMAKQIAEKLVRALSEKGLAFLVNHGLPAYKMRRVYGALQTFCKLPKESRDVISTASSEKHGYIRAETESYTEEDACHTYIIDGNQTPFPDEQLPSMHTVVDDFSVDIKQLASQLLTALAMGLDVPPKFFISKHANLLKPDNQSSICCIYRPNTSLPSPGQLRHGPTQDPGTFTLICQDFDCGLEIRRPNTSIWESVGYLPGAILIMSGECLAKWTNNQIPALLYRGVTSDHHHRSRHLISFVVKPDDDVVIEPIDTKIVSPVQEPVLCRLQKKKRGVLGAYHHLQRRFREAYAS